MTSLANTSLSRADLTFPSDSNVEGQAQSITLQLTALMLALLIPTALGAIFDERLTYGVNGWLKPLKFQVSLAIHFGTLALLLGFMAPAARAGRAVRWSMMAAAMLAALEVAYIMMQAGRARASHFNNDTRFEEVAYALMGLGAATIVILTFVVGLMLWRHPRPGVTPAMRLAAGGGLMFAGLATLVVAGYMSSRGAHSVGAVASQAGSLPLMGWSTKHGDLRAPHFFATHAAQAVPLFALAWERLKGNSAALPVAVFLALYAAFTLAVFVQALMGVPFLPWR
jgi:hypothetical protein